MKNRPYLFIFTFLKPAETKLRLGYWCDQFFADFFNLFISRPTTREKLDLNVFQMDIW